MSIEGKSRSLTILFGITAVAVVVFFVVSMFRGTSVMRESVVEDVTIVGKTKDNRVID